MSESEVSDAVAAELVVVEVLPKLQAELSNDSILISQASADEWLQSAELSSVSESASNQLLVSSGDSVASSLTEIGISASDVADRDEAVRDSLFARLSLATDLEFDADISDIADAVSLEWWKSQRSA
jgi:hypothetical protein